MNCVQRESGMVSWFSTFCLERSVVARCSACPTHRRRFWLSSACVCIDGTSVACKTWACVHMCSSGDLRATKHHNYFRHGYVCLFISRITHKKLLTDFRKIRWKGDGRNDHISPSSQCIPGQIWRRLCVERAWARINGRKMPSWVLALRQGCEWLPNESSPRCIWLLHISSVSTDGIYHPHQRNAYNTAPWNHLVLPSVLWQCWLWKEVGCRFGGGDDTTRALHDPQLQLSPLTTSITLSSDEIQNGAILVRFTRGLS